MRTPEQIDNDLTAVLDRLEEVERNQVDLREQSRKNRRLARGNHRQITVLFLTVAAIASGVALLTVADSAVEQNLLSALTLLSWSSAVAVATGKFGALENLLNHKPD